MGNYRPEGEAIAPIVIRLIGSATIDLQVPSIVAMGSRARPIKPVASSVVERTITVVAITRSGETIVVTLLYDMSEFLFCYKL